MKYLYVTFFALISVMSQSQNKMDSYYNHGRLVQFYQDEDIIVSANLETTKWYGKFYTVNISILNLGIDRADIVPEQISATLIQSGKTKKAEVYTFEKMRKNIRNKQLLEESIIGLSIGAQLATQVTASSISKYDIKGSSGQSISAIDVKTYDSRAEDMRIEKSLNRLDNLEKSQLADIRSINTGYLLRHTIFPGEELNGYVNIKFNPCNEIQVNIPFKGKYYLFKWTLQTIDIGKRVEVSFDDLYN